MAGLLAAWVLADCFDHVIVVEADILQAQPEPRRCAPQTACGHSVLLRGLQILEELFPNCTSELGAYGGFQYDLAKDVRAYRFGRWLPRFPSGLQGMYCCGRACGSMPALRGVFDAQIQISLRAHLECFMNRATVLVSFP
jgi:hypothetical protein